MSANSLMRPATTRAMTRRLSLAARILGAHGLGLALAIPVLWLVNRAGLEAGFGLLAVVQGLAAAWLSRRFGLPVWWHWINLAFCPWPGSPRKPISMRIGTSPV
jgi:hypothetical protein